MDMDKKRGYREKGLQVAGATLLLASASLANADSPSSDWRYGLQIYGWFPGISGDLRYDLPGTGGGVDVDASKIIDSLQFTFMGTFEARKGPWSGFTDLIYLNLGGDKSNEVTLPNNNVQLDADLDLEGWIWTLGGAYETWRDKESYLDLLAGARMLQLDSTVKLTGSGPLNQDRKLEESITVWDGIVGAKGNFAINDRWFVPYYADVGAGNSNFTWQLMGGIGYKFKWGQATLAYRHLAYDQDGDQLLQDVAFSGPMLGVGFRF